MAYSDENPPVRILLCADRDEEAVRCATAGDSDIFVTRYRYPFELPTEQHLKSSIQAERAQLEQLHDASEEEVD